MNVFDGSVSATTTVENPYCSCDARGVRASAIHIPSPGGLTYCVVLEKGAMRVACETCQRMDFSPEAVWISYSIGESIATALCHECSNAVVKLIQATFVAPEKPSDIEAQRARMAHAREVKMAKRQAILEGAN